MRTREKIHYDQFLGFLKKLFCSIFVEKNYQRAELITAAILNNFSQKLQRVIFKLNRKATLNTFYLY